VRLTLVEAVRDGLATAMAADPRVVVLGLDVGRLGGVFRATDGLLDRFGPRRVIDTPLSEAAIVGSSIGLAVSGLVPVVELQFLGFALQAAHQVGPQLARYRYRSRGRYEVPVTIRAPFGAGVRSAEFHFDAIEAMFTHCPGLKVAAPSTPADARGLLLEAIRDPDPVLFLEPVRLYRRGREEVPEGEQTVPFGKIRLAREGSDVTLVAWSAAVELCERAATDLAGRGVEASVLDLRSLVPLDVEGLVRSVARTRRCVVVQEGPLTGGFGAEIAATLQEEAFETMAAPVARVAAYDLPLPAGVAEPWNVPDAARVVAAAEAVLG
jgi:pyruvate dehydrogenase E1 component beta subunit